MIKPIGTPFEENSASSDDPATDFPFEEFEAETAFDTGEFEVEYNVESTPPLQEECTAFFEPGGILSQAALLNSRPCEERPQQLEMARAIADALAAGENLCIEAPTGVGKSFAYLVPLIYRSRYCKRPALVSTETIHLQQQLIEKDLPLLQKLTGIEFKAALAKGRHNYICRRRLALLSGEQRDALLPAPSLVADVEHVLKKLKDGIEGERDALDLHISPECWNMICCEGGNCAGQKCEYFKSCCYYRARRQWENSDIIVANHALFFTDLAMRGAEGASLLPDYGAVLIDEAHTLEDNAAEYLGLHLSLPQMVGVLNKLYNPENSRGLLMRPGAANVPLRALAAAARDEAYGFFAPYEKLLRDSNETARSVPENFCTPDRLSPALLELCRQLGDAIEDEEDDSFKTELRSQRERCGAFIDGIGQFTGRAIQDAVYYAESDRGTTALAASPLNVSELLAKLLFEQDFPVILCSATLTVRQNFDYFVQRTGFTGGSTLRLDSPFDPAQAKLIVARNVPDPAAREYLPELVNAIRKCVTLSSGKAFVLFTSYQTLRYCADALRGEFASHGWRLLEQGGELSRFQMLREFKEDVDSVLFGTDSFWTGVDVPGEALSMVVITKLPFTVPSHPLIKARVDRLDANGARKGFSSYTLPEAVLKFRQGVGRLIRSRSDRGWIVILDPRIKTRFYGKTFLDSIPYAESGEEL